MASSPALDTHTRHRLETNLSARQDDQQAFLAKLVACPSDNPPGDCVPHGELTARLLEDLGFTVEKHPVDPDALAACGMTSATNLIVRRTFDRSGPVIALNAHGDVVPPGEGWSKDPYGADVEDGVMYGRGVAVSKSDFATYTFALLALDTVAEDLLGSVELHFTYDEETGGEIGPRRLLRQGLSKPDLCISAGFCHSVVTAHNGCLHLEVTVRGTSAHAAKPDSGADALEAATALMTRLYALRRDFPSQVSDLPGIGHPNITIGLIEGGINTNVVPDRVTLRLDRRMTPEEDATKVEADLRQLIADSLSGFAGIKVDITRLLLASPLKRLPGAERLIEPLQRYGQDVLLHPLAEEGVPLYTDARLYAQEGIPTVAFGAGPASFLEANGHRADEKLVLSDLKAATKIVAFTLAELLARQT
ncbi:M20/M25/M40 family metallo-hydrolase [Rhodovibrionaceae bacterium A322]